MLNFGRRKNLSKNSGYFSNFLKLTQINNHTEAENLHNLVNKVDRSTRPVTKVAPSSPSLADDLECLTVPASSLGTYLGSRIE
jgi:hypothetical protein